MDGLSVKVCASCYIEMSHMRLGGGTQLDGCSEALALGCFCACTSVHWHAAIRVCGRMMSGGWLPRCHDLAFQSLIFIPQPAHAPHSCFHLTQRSEALCSSTSTHPHTQVFRTYNASVTLDRLLAELEKSSKSVTVDEKKADYDKANKEVAILCNHQRSVPKTHGTAVRTVGLDLKRWAVSTRLQAACAVACCNACLSPI